MTWTLSPRYWSFVEGSGRFPSQRTSYVELGCFLLLVWWSCWTNSQLTAYSRRHYAHMTSPWWFWLNAPLYTVRILETANRKNTTKYVTVWTTLVLNGARIHCVNNSKLRLVFREKTYFCTKFQAYHVQTTLGMNTSNHGNAFGITGFVRGIHLSPVGSPHKGSKIRCGALIFSLFLASILLQQIVEQTIYSLVIWDALTLM